MHYEEYAVAGGAPLKKALRFYGDACRLDPYRFCVARAYAKGETVTIDRARAEDFYRQSYTLGFEFSCQNLAIIEMWDGDPTTREDRFIRACPLVPGSLRGLNQCGLQHSLKTAGGSAWLSRWNEG